MTDLIAKYLEIPLTKIQKEHQQSVVKAELIQSPSENLRVISKRQNNSSVCSVQ